MTSLTGKTVLLSIVFMGSMSLLLLPTCAGPEDPPEFEPLTSRYTRVSGDFHVHATGASNDTGGDSWPSAITSVATARELDFVVLMDHSNSTGSDPDTTFEDPALFNLGPEFPHWDSAAILSDPSFTLVVGCELSPRATELNFLQPTGHIGFLPLSLSTVDTSLAFTDRPMGTVDGNEMVQQVLDAGGWPLLFHPYAVAPWIRYDWSSYDYRGMEVWNGTGGWDEFDESGRRAWLCDLLQGRQTFPVGGSDNHRVNISAPGSGSDPALGYPQTIIWSDSEAWEDILSALERGYISVAEGASELFLTGHDAEGQLVTSGSSDASWIRWTGQTDAAAIDPVLTVVRCRSCEDPRPSPVASPVPDEEILFEESLSAGERFEGWIEIAGTESGVYNAIIRSASGHYGALSGAHVVP